MVGSKRILIIEDEEPLQELYSEILNRHNYMVEVAENGRIGFRKGATFDYDVIVCDLHMPDWNGVEAIKAILMVKPQCRFIVISAFADRKIVDELYDIPEVKQIFSKPADLNEIIGCISAI